MQCPHFHFGAKGSSVGVEYRGIRQRFPYRCNETEDQQDGRTEVTMEPKTASPPEPFTGEDHSLQICPPLLAPFPLNIWGEDQGLYK